MCCKKKRCFWDSDDCNNCPGPCAPFVILCSPLDVCKYSCSCCCVLLFIFSVFFVIIVSPVLIVYLIVFFPIITCFYYLCGCHKESYSSYSTSKIYNEGGGGGDCGGGMGDFGGGGDGGGCGGVWWQLILSILSKLLDSILLDMLWMLLLYLLQWGNGP